MFGSFLFSTYICPDKKNNSKKRTNMKKLQKANRTMLHLCYALLAVSLVGLVSCKKPPVDDGDDGPIQVDNDYAQGQIVISEDYQPIDWNKSENHVSVADTATGRFVLELGKDEKKAVQKGDILTLDVDSTIFLRKVTSVTKEDGSVVIETRQAYLEEVFAGSNFRICIGTPPDSLLAEMDSIDNATRAAGKPVPVTIYPSEIRYKDENGNWVKEPYDATRGPLKEGWQHWDTSIQKDIELKLNGDYGAVKPKVSLGLTLNPYLDYAFSLEGDLLEVAKEDYKNEKEALEAIKKSKSEWKPTFMADFGLKGSATLDFKVEASKTKRISTTGQEVGSLIITTLTAMVGLVPVCICIGTGLDIENSFTISGGFKITTGFDIGLQKAFSVYAEKDAQGEWSGHIGGGGFKCDLNFPSITLGAEIDDSLSICPKLFARIYGLAGPYAKIKPVFHFNVAAGGGVNFGSKDVTGIKDFTGVNATLGWNAKVGFIPMWCVGAGASRVLGGGAFETKPKKITPEKTLYLSPNFIECLNPTAAKVGELCAMKFKVSSWFSYLVGSTTWGTKVPVPVHFRDTDVFLGNGNKEIKENQSDPFEDWCYKWTDWGTGEVTVYWMPKSKSSTLTACFFAADGSTADECTVVPDMSPPDVKAVDLGLSVYWANTNVSTFENPGVSGSKGDLVGWGDNKGTYNMQWENPDWGNYVSDPGAALGGYGGTKRSTNITGGPYDWATTHWGGAWRTPTKEQWEELMKKCTWQWDSKAKAFKVTGEKGNYIYLPADGWECGLEGKGGEGTELDYWSSTIDKSVHWAYDDGSSSWQIYPVAWYFYAKPMQGAASGATMNVNGNQRCYRHSIRPVMPKPR